MPFFEEEMPQIKLGDLDNIPVSSRKVSGGRSVKGRQYPNRDGQASEDLGREPWVFELEIPLFKTVDDNHYPAMADQLQLLLDDPPDDLEFRDHEFGTMQVSVGPWSRDMEATKRDGVIIRVQLTEDLLDTPFAVRELVAAPNVETAGADLDAALERAGVTEPNVQTQLNRNGVGLTTNELGFTAGDMWSGQGAAFMQRLNDGIATAEQIAAIVDTVRARVDVLLGLPQLQDPAYADAVIAAILFADAMALAGQVVIASSTPIVEQVIVEPISVFELALLLYGDIDRVEEILQRNPLVDPLFIAPGTRMQVAA